jgi:hypothetical protein
LQVGRDADLPRTRWGRGVHRSLEHCHPEFVRRLVDDSAGLVAGDVGVEVRRQERGVRREREDGTERPDGGVEVGREVVARGNLEVWLHRRRERLDQDGGEVVVDAGNRDGHAPPGPPDGLVVQRVVARVRPHVLGDPDAVGLLERAEVRRAPPYWRDGPHRVEDERPVVGGEALPRPLVPLAERLPLAPEAGPGEAVGFGVEFDVVDAELLPALGLLEHLFRDGRRSSLAVDRVRLEFDADRVPARVEATVPTVARQPQGLLRHPSVELDARLGVE